METLEYIDQAIFHFINGTIHNIAFDYFFAAMRERIIWVPVYVFAVFFLLSNYKRDGWVIVAILLALIAVSDQSTSFLMKPMIGRARPCQIAALHTHLPSLVDCGVGYSMPSSHASNHFAMAAFFGLLFYKKYSKLLLALCCWASVICLAQVYCGVHFPFDVLVGAIWGFGLGTAAYYICKRFLTKAFYADPLPAPPRRRRRTHRLIFDPKLDSHTPTDLEP